MKREELGLSAREIARRSGMSDSHVLCIEKDQREPTFQKLTGLMKSLGVSWEEFLRETGYLGDGLEIIPVGKYRKIPVLSFVNAGKFEEYDIPTQCQSNECIETNVLGENIFALRVACDSMEPEFYEGDIIIVNPDVEASVNDFVIVNNGENESTLKQLKRYGNNWVLHPLNPKYQDIMVKKNKFRIIGKVIKKEKKY